MSRRRSNGQSGWHISGKKLTLVPILRAGLGMVEGILRLVPAARVGHIGLYRDHDTLQPVDYYFKIPGDVAERDFFRARSNAGDRRQCRCCGWLPQEGRRNPDSISLSRRCAGRSQRLLSAAHPDVQIYCAALDRELNSQGYILPGLGRCRRQAVRTR